MSDAKHAPAPWEYEYRETPNGGLTMQVFRAVDPDNTIATAHWHSVKTETGFTTNREANARLISAAPDLLAALDGLQQFFAMPDECSIGRFDRLAEQYRRETGNWAPGKSIPDAYNDSTDDDTRRNEYDAWVQSKVDAARAAIARAKGGAE